MTDFQSLGPEELQKIKAELLNRYDEFKSRDITLDMTRGKPCSEQLNLAMDMLERMRTNKRRLNRYIQGNMELGGGTQGVPGILCNSVADNCDGIDMSRVDLWEWERRLDGVAEDQAGAATGGLVSPTACLDGPPGGGTGTYTVAIAWRGVTELTNPAASDCGEDSGLYGDNNEFRRVLVISSYIDAN